jgi:hypothetical protein
VSQPPNKMKLKGTFERGGSCWHFVLPVGTLVAEFIRLHTKGVWKDNPEGLVMDIPAKKDGVATCYHFDKVLKQVNSGEKENMHAFYSVLHSFHPLAMRPKTY